MRQARPVPDWEFRLEARVNAPLPGQLAVVVLGRVQRLMRVLDVMGEDRGQVPRVLRTVPDTVAHRLEGVDKATVDLGGPPREASRLLDSFGAIARDVRIPVARDTREGGRLV